MLISCFVKHENLIYIKVFLFIVYCEKLKLGRRNGGFLLPSISRLSVLIGLNESKIVAFYCSITSGLFVFGDSLKQISKRKTM